MIILNEDNIKEIGIDWRKTIGAIEDTVQCLIEKDFAQPLKPYLHYRNMKNRIIAMPAFVGGKVNMAGIKWISSFPDNIKKGLARAHSVVILNDGDTGEPVAIVTTALLSIIRTASVSGLIIERFNQIHKLSKIQIGIIGFGPIGQYHLKMCLAILGPRIDRIFVYDILPVDTTVIESDLVTVVGKWEDAYLTADIVITCTVSDEPYIDKVPKAGSLHLNVSLRDYKTITYEWFKDSIIVDSWEEVCRHKTDIERMHLERGLQKEQTRSVMEVIQNNCLKNYQPSTPILFNPMGMAVFDIAIAHLYYQLTKAMSAVDS